MQNYKVKCKNPAVSIDLIVQDLQGRILLGKLSERWQEGGKYLWGLPGREVSFGETLKACAERNLKGELNIEMTAGKIVCINSNFGFGNHYISVGILVAASSSPRNKKSEDWQGWKWFDKGKIPKKLFPSAEKTLKSFLENKISLDF
jgi:ADP-ribose pyrophosphatase YjhB (NUDIX family)